MQKIITAIDKIISNSTLKLKSRPNVYMLINKYKIKMTARMFFWKYSKVIFFDSHREPIKI